jgi:heat shock protein 5
VLVLHVGGGTAEASVVTLTDGGYFDVLAYRHDPFLGGDDFDRRVVDYFVNLIKMKHSKDVSQDRIALRKLGVACERAKKALSSQDHAQVSIKSLFGGGMDFSESLSRPTFEKLSGDLFWKVIALVDSAMADSELERSEIDEIILVGGSTMIPKIQRLVKDYFYGKKPNIRVKPDEAVALGAAVKIHSLKYRRSQSLDLIYR